MGADRMRTVRRTAILWIMGGVALFATPALALATPGWSAPGEIGVPSGALAANITYASGGTATIAYVQITSQSPLATALHVGVIAPGGIYVDQLTIPSTANALPASVSLSEAPDGAAVIEYLTTSSTAPNANVAAYAMERPAGSDTWGNPVTVTPPAARDSVHPTQLVTAISADATAAAGIERIDSTDASPGGDRIDVAVASHGGSWGSPTEISLSGEDNESLALAFDSSDNLTAAFTSATPASTERPTAEVATRSGSAGVWGAPVMVSAASPTDFLGSALHLGLAPDGSAVVAYQLVTVSNTLDTWATTRSGANGAWSLPTDVTPGSTSAAPEAVGVSPSDKAYVVYTFQGSNSGLNCIGAVRANVGGSFTAPACASAQNYQSFAIAGVAFLGNDAYFAFTGAPNGGADDDLEADRWTDIAARPDTPTTIVSPRSVVPSLLSVEPDESGGVPILFSTDSGTTIDASAWDTAGPSLVSSSVPATAVAGQTVSLAATFTDLWANPVTPPTWSFGDGTSASGSGVSHIYTAPGTYLVHAVSADALGNTTTTPFTITVTASATSTATSTATAVTPKLTGVKQTRTSWLEKKRSHPKGKQPVVGTAFHFVLSPAATVTMTFTGSRTGRRAGKKCVAETRKNAKQTRCTMTFKEGETIKGRSGANTVRFLGLVKGHPKLTPGKYTVTFTARSGTLASRTSTLHFAILRP
jgi:PKD domain